MSYPQHLTKNLSQIEGKLLSCIAQDISLFQEIPESIGIDNFRHEENKIFFKVYKTLYDKKYSTIDEVAINGEFPIGSADRVLFESYYGSEMTKTFKQAISSIDNFDKFKDDFLEVNSKMALYDEMKRCIGLFEKEEFCNESTEHIYSYIDHNVTNAVISINSESDLKNLEIDDDFIERCKKGEAVGISYGLPEYNKLTLGMHLSNLSLLSMPNNTGKSSMMFAEFAYKYALEKERVFIYSNETSEDDFKTMLLVITLVKKYKEYHITKTKLKTGNLTEEQWKIVGEAREYIKENLTPHITIKYPKSHNMKEFISYLRRYAYRGYKYFFLDTMKSDEAGNSQAVGLLVDQSRSIYEACKKLNVHCLATVQIALYHIQNQVRVLTESHLAGSKQIADVCDIIITGRDIYLDEFKGEKHEIKAWKLVSDDNGETYRKDYKELDRDKKYLVMNNPKNRYGQKGVLMIYEKLGHLGIFNQVGYCQVKGE